VAGQVVAVYAHAGDTLTAGVPLFGVRTGTGTTEKVQTVRTVSAGRITTLSAPLGSVVETGSELAVVERVTSPDEPLVAVLYASATSASSIPVGADVDLTVQSVPVQQYGLLRGRVLSVGRSPESQQQITGFLGSGQLAQAFSAQGEPVAVVVQLERFGSSRSGYAWSTTEGPPYQLQSTELVSAAVHVPGQHPIDWILP
jgi:pyruvate/2-oxoglutarate dehydrogenase complex dihydrolipoamide acyltransferase (E2) component